MYADIGSISEGTLRTEDLLEACARELQALDKDGEFEVVVLAAELVDPDSDDAHEILEELYDALQEFAPPYVAFGAHEGDGASIGFWPQFDRIQEDIRFGDLPSVNDPSELGMVGEGHDFAVHVNDHGNMTLYERTEYGAWVRIWDCV